MSRINADLHLSDGSNATLDGKVLSAKNTMINNDSSWSDVNYTTGDGNHLARVTDFVRAYTRSSSTYFNSTDIYNRIVKALSYWHRRNPVNSNWWYNEISFPQQIGRILILMRYTTTPLSSTLESNLVVRMTKGNPYVQTGANKTDIALHFLYRSCLVERISLLDTAATQSFETIAQNNGGEELQYDNSYFQHGSQLAIASYGTVYVNNAYTVANYLRGTSYSLSAGKLALLSKFNIETYNNTIRGKYFDFSVVGRGISRSGGTQAGSSYYKQKLVDPANNANWDAATARISQQQPPSYMVIPLHTHYWRGDYDLHQRSGYLFTVRTVSTRTLRTERGNNENILGKFLPDGGTAIMRTGSEYFNIYPLWEWDKVPGVTSRNFSTDQPITVDWGQQGNTSFVGGVSDSLYGVSVYDQNYNSVAAKKAWFFFDNEVVCLGAGISSTQPESVTSTLNQSWLKGAVYTSDNGNVNTMSTNTSATLTSPQWILHDSIGYFFPSGGNATVSNQQQSGNWYNINQSQANAVVTGNVFKLWLNHGAQPANSKYAYIVAPGISTVAEMQVYPVNNNKIIVNSDSIQAVRNLQQQIMQVVFYKAGTLTDDSVKITVDKPCVVMMRQLNSSQVPVWVADPTHANSTVTISLEVPQIGGRKMLVAQLPQSPYAGSSIRLLFDSNSPDFPPLPDSLIAVADAYVRDGSYANNNYGTVAGLPVKKDGTGYSREIYFKFDFHGVTYLPETAKLRLYCTGGNVTAGTTQWALYKMNSNSWTETGINWNNKPTVGTLVGSRQGQTAAGFVDWDISSLIATIPSDSLLSFRLISTVTGSTTDASFSSREAAAERKPAIILSYNQFLSSSANFSSVISERALQLNERIPLAAADFSVTVYPNPSTVEFQLVIRGDAAKPVTAKMFDMQGRMIKTIKTTTGTLYEGKEWKPGIYFIEVQQDGKREIVKVIKL
jgi:chondroitin AC lyase